MIDYKGMLGWLAFDSSIEAKDKIAMLEATIKYIDDLEKWQSDCNKLMDSTLPSFPVLNL